MRRHVKTAAILVTILGITGLAVPVGALEVGQKAPDFTLTGPGNKLVRLADLLGKGPVVVYTIIQAFSAV
jgi:hypothetical protein